MRTVTSAPATPVLIKPATLLMCEFSMTTGAVVATVTAGVLLSVLQPVSGVAAGLGDDDRAAPVYLADGADCRKPRLGAPGSYQ